MKIHVKTLVNFCVHYYSQCNELYNTQVFRGTLIADSSFEQLFKDLYNMSTTKHFVHKVSIQLIMYLIFPSLNFRSAISQNGHSNKKFGRFES